MLQSYQYRAALGDVAPSAAVEVIRKLAARLIRVQPKLRGLRLEEQDGHLNITIRVAGNTRWDISHDSKDLIIRLTRAARIRTDAVKLEQVVTEINGRQLHLGEGRTEMTRRPRAQRIADGNPWDIYEWWGDSLDSEEDAGV